MAPTAAEWASLQDQLGATTFVAWLGFLIASVSLCCTLCGSEHVQRVRALLAEQPQHQCRSPTKLACSSHSGREPSSETRPGGHRQGAQHAPSPDSTASSAPIRSRAAVPHSSAATPGGDGAAVAEQAFTPSIPLPPRVPQSALTTCAPPSAPATCATPQPQLQQPFPPPPPGFSPPLPSLSVVMPSPAMNHSPDKLPSLDSLQRADAHAPQPTSVIQAQSHAAANLLAGLHVAAAAKRVNAAQRSERIGGEMTMVTNSGADAARGQSNAAATAPGACISRGPPPTCCGRAATVSELLASTSAHCTRIERPSASTLTAPQLQQHRSGLPQHGAIAPPGGGGTGGPMEGSAAAAAAQQGAVAKLMAGLRAVAEKRAAHQGGGGAGHTTMMDPRNGAAGAPHEML
jgi:hypothetical protein